MVVCHLPGSLDMNIDDSENGDTPLVVVVLLFIRECIDNYPGTLALPLEA